MNSFCGVNLFGNAIFFREKMASCCHKDMGIPYKETLTETIEDYHQYLKDISEDLEKGKKTDCSNCPLFGINPIPKRFTEYAAIPGILSVDIGSDLHGGRCNFKCEYCGFDGEKNDKRRIFPQGVTEILLYFEAQKENIYLRYAHGEITVDPAREDVFRILYRNTWFTRFYTNALMYSDQIAGLMERDMADVFVSIDSGSESTFRSLKGVDCYRAVVETLTRYQKKGRICLKYILIPGVNDNPHEYEGFLRLANSLGSYICVSYDGRQNRKVLSAMQRETLRNFIVAASTFPNRVDFTPQLFSLYDMQWILGVLERGIPDDQKVNRLI